MERQLEKNRLLTKVQPAVARQIHEL